MVVAKPVPVLLLRHFGSYGVPRIVGSSDRSLRYDRAERANQLRL